MKQATIGLIGLGFALLLLSGLWTVIFPASSRWTPDKEARAQKVKARLHSLSFVVGNPQHASMHSGQDTGQAKAEFDALNTEHDQLNADFASATETPRTISNFLKWSGLSLAAVGLVGWYAVNQSR
jgi:hypothetical protein